MKYKIRKVAVTGATGTLGVSLIKQCVEDGIEVIAFMNPGSKNASRIEDHPLITKIDCALDEMESFDVGDLRAEAFIHLGWGSTNRAIRNNMKPQVDNIKYAIDSVDLAERLGCSVYVGAGSQAEYGNKSAEITEDQMPEPVVAYGMAKLCAGQMTRSLCRDKGIRHIWPRMFSSFGPYTQDTTIINYSILSLLKNESPKLTACEQVWDFLYVDEMSRALLLLANDGKDGEIYNISGGQTRTLYQYLTVVEAMVKEMHPELTASIEFGALPYGPTTVMHLEGNIEKIRNDVGFEPMISFEEGIKRTIEFYSNN